MHEVVVPVGRLFEAHPVGVAPPRPPGRGGSCTRRVRWGECGCCPVAAAATDLSRRDCWGWAGRRRSKGGADHVPRHLTSRNTRSRSCMNIGTRVRTSLVPAVLPCHGAWSRIDTFRPEGGRLGTVPENVTWAAAGGGGGDSGVLALLLPAAPPPPPPPPLLAYLLAMSSARLTDCLRGPSTCGDACGARSTECGV